MRTPPSASVSTMRKRSAVGRESSHGVHAGIVIELLDPATGRALWHGLGYETWYDSMDPATEIRRAVQSVLAQYPPPSG